MSLITDSDLTDLKLYEYKPLPPNTSRLLRLRPATNGTSDLDAELVEFHLPGSPSSLGYVAARKSKNKVSGKRGSTSLHNANGGIAAATVPKGIKATGPEHSDEDIDRIVPYEAISWCWGREKANQLLRLHDGDHVYALLISPNLKAALFALRKHNKVRTVWIDAICINQRNLEERNIQVPRMDIIYGNAEKVCIWLGEGDADSKLAMDFINNKVLDLWKFDELIEDRHMTRNWAALINLMKRPWFSRRWVVQEIALSPSANNTIYCGKEQVPWQDFADAVSLFVNVESATHKLSDVMKLENLFNHMPDFFGDVSSLGAALLVDATSNLFRNSSTGQRKPLSTLEYLVSRLSIFEASQPRDTIYALLAISKDTTPKNAEDDPAIRKTEKALEKFLDKQAFAKLANQPYKVDYNLPVVEVYKEFIEFSIHKSEKTRALDIICRPWAPTVMKSHDKPYFQKDPSGLNTKKNQIEEEDDEEAPLPSWIPSVSFAAFEMEQHPIIGLRMQRQNADPLVGMPGTDHRNYSAAGTRALDVKKLKFSKKDYRSPWDKPLPNSGNLRKLLLKSSNRSPNSTSSPDSVTDDRTMGNWTRRTNHNLDHSMFVQGFILDEIETVERKAASNGNMPYQWLRPGGWMDTDQNPPEEFWRTLVADRGPNGSNPPTYFPRACREAMKFKDKLKSKVHGNLDSKLLINEGRCTIVAEFLRRVQAVIWNRLLMRTKGVFGEPGRLGLVREDVQKGYKVCILYGCSVPVILQEIEKTPEQILEDQISIFQEWLEMRKRMTLFCRAKYIKVKLRKQKLEEAQKSEAQKQKPRLQTSQTLPVIASSSEQRKSQELSPVSPGPSHDDNPRQDQANGKSPARDYGSIVPSPKAKQTESKSVEKPRNNEEAWAIYLNKKLKISFSEFKERGKQELEKRENLEYARAEVLASKPYYRLFGECYVHDMMNGEAIAFQNLHEIKEQTFELR